MLIMYLSALLQIFNLFVLYLNVGSICKLLMFTHFPCYLDRENHVYLQGKVF